MFALAESPGFTVAEEQLVFQKTEK